MKDYEQLYYDAIYEIKKLKNKIDILEQEIEIYKNIQINKDVKSLIINDLMKYLKRRNFK